MKHEQSEVVRLTKAEIENIKLKSLIATSGQVERVCAECLMLIQEKEDARRQILKAIRGLASRLLEMGAERGHWISRDVCKLYNIADAALK